MPPETTALVDPQGVIRDVPASQVAASIAARWRAPTTEDTARLSGEAAQEQDYGGTSGAVKAAMYGLARGGSLGLSDVGFRALGADPQDLKGYQQQHPGLSTGSEFAGALLPGLVAPESLFARTPAGQVSRIGRSIVSGAESRGAGVLGRAAASTAGAAAEGALYGGGQYLSQVALDDKPLAAEGFIAAMGKGALWAAPVGGALSLGESALVRAKSLFPRSEVSKQAARAVDQEATSAIAQSVQDGDMMVAAAQRRIAQAGAAVGKAEAGERVARTMFGDAHPQAAIDQVTSGLEHQQLTQAVSDYTQSRQALADWVRAEADPDLEAALARIASPDVQVGAPRLRSPEFGEVVPPQGDLPSMGEFGLEKTAVGKKLAQGTPGPHVPPRVPVTTEMPPLPLGDAEPVAASARPFSDEEYKAYKKGYGNAADAHLPSEMYYSKGGDEIVNPALRSGKPLEGEAAKLRDGLDAAFAEPESRIPRDLTLYRGLSDDAMLGTHGVKARFANVKPGDVLEDPAFTSTAFSEKAKSRNEQVVFTIHAPAGTPALPLRGHYSFEGEMLLPRGTKMRVDSIEYVPVTDRWKIDPKAKVEKLPDGTVRFTYPSGEVGTHPPIKDIHVTIVGEHAPPSIASRAPRVDLSAPIEKLSRRQLNEFKDALNEAFDKAGQGTPEYERLLKIDEVATARARALADGKLKDVSDYVAAETANSLTGQLRGMQGRLTAGENLKAMGAPSRAEYAANKAAKTEEAAAHFRAKATGSNLDDFFANLTSPKSRDAYVAQNIGRAMREEGSHAAGLAKLEKEWAAIAQPGRSVGRETIPIDFQSTGPKFDPKTRTYHGASETPPSGEMNVGLHARVTPEDVTGVHVQKARVGNIDDLRKFIGEKDWSKVAPEEWLAQAESMGGQFGHSRDIAKTIVDKSIKPGMERVVEEDAIQAALRKHNGKNVDIGADLSRAVKVLGDHEAANAKLVDLLGSDAPRTAVEHAKIYRSAIAAQHDAAAASAAQSAADLGSKVKPAIDGGTVVDSDITKALRKHDMASSAAAGRAVRSLGKQAAKETAPAARKSHSLLGIAADVGTALEVLHAMGVHTPDVSAIPVIGPVLSLYLKARAVLGVIGRKGGSVGRSTESVVAARAAVVRDRINAAANAALDVGAKAMRRAQPIAGPAGALAYKLFPGKGDTTSKDPRVLYQARVDELARAQVPGAIENAIADRIRTSDPVLQDALIQKSTKLIQFLDSKRPGQGLLQSPIPGDGDWRPSKSAIEEFSRYVAAAHDPAGVLEDLAHGHPSKEGAETLRAIYPELYAAGQRALMERASQIQHTLPYARRVSISLMYQVPVDLTMSAAHMQYLKPPEPMPSATPPGAPPMGAPGLTGPLQLGQQTLTSLERRAGA